MAFTRSAVRSRLSPQIAKFKNKGELNLGTLNNLRNCKEIFVTNSIFGVRPVLKIGKSVYSTGQKTIEIKEFLQELGM